MIDVERQIRGFVIAELMHKLVALDIPMDMVTGDFDLMGSGVLDSISFIELVGAVEMEFKFEIDFEDLDPAEFTVVDGFIACALDSMNSE